MHVVVFTVPKGSVVVGLEALECYLVSSAWLRFGSAWHLGSLSTAYTARLSPGSRLQLRLFVRMVGLVVCDCGGY